jgi:hypothetical protein
MTLAAAYEFRGKGAELARKKETPGLESVYFGMSNSISTRIRVEVQP